MTKNKKLPYLVQTGLLGKPYVLIIKNNQMYMLLLVMILILMRKIILGWSMFQKKEPLIDWQLQVVRLNVIPLFLISSMMEILQPKRDRFFTRP